MMTPPIIPRRWAVVVVAYLLFCCVSTATQETSDRATKVIVDNGEEEEAEPVVVATDGLVVEEHHDDVVGGERILAHQDDPVSMEATVPAGRIIIKKEDLLLDNDTSPKGHHHAGKWGTAATTESSPSLGDDSQFTMDSLAATAGAANNASRIGDGGGGGKQRRSWGQVDHSSAPTNPQETTNGSSATTANEVGEPEESKTETTTEAASPPKGGSSSSTITRHIPNLAKSKYVDSGSGENDKNAFPEGFRLSARVYTATDDGLAHFDDTHEDGDDDNLFLPYVYCGADGSTTAGLRVDRIYVREAIAAPTVWDNNYGGGGDDRVGDASSSRPPTLAIALRPFGMKLDSGEERHFRPGNVVLLEDTIRPGHQMFASSDDKQHRDLVVMFVTLRRPHYDIGREHSSIHKQLATTTTSRPRRHKTSSSSSCDNSSNEPSLLQTALEWHERRTRMVIVGIVSFSLSTLVAEFLAKTMPLLLAAGIGGLGFVTGATYGLTVLVESIFTKLHVRAVRRRLDQKRQRARRPTVVVDEDENEEERQDEH